MCVWHAQLLCLTSHPNLHLSKLLCSTPRPKHTGICSYPCSDMVTQHSLCASRLTAESCAYSTMGRAFTSGMNMASKGPLASLASASASQTQMQGPAQDQPELDARYVYVGVHADGPTRVLCFSDTRDQYTRGTNEESIALLSSKLKRLEGRIPVRHPPRPPAGAGRSSCIGMRASGQVQQ